MLKPTSRGLDLQTYLERYVTPPLLVRPFAVGFSAGTLLLLVACSASGPEPEAQANSEPAPSLVRERLAAPAAAEMHVEASQKRMAPMAYAPAYPAYSPPPGVNLNINVPLR